MQIYDTLNESKYLILDNLLDTSESNLIENILFDPYFPWFLTAGRDSDGNMYTVSSAEAANWKDDPNVVAGGQFTHSFFYIEDGTLVENSVKKDIVLSIISKFLITVKLNTMGILRAKANLITESRKYTKTSYDVPHTDSNIDHYVLIYYVNDSDGDTVLFDENKKIFARITPKKGRGLFFKGDILHAGGHPVNNANRCVININLQRIADTST